jgi:hypothetical protein
MFAKRKSDLSPEPTSSSPGLGSSGSPSVARKRHKSNEWEFEEKEAETDAETLGTAQPRESNESEEGRRSGPNTPDGDNGADLDELQRQHGAEMEITVTLCLQRHPEAAQMRLARAQTVITAKALPKVAHPVRITLVLKVEARIATSIRGSRSVV